VCHFPLGRWCCPDAEELMAYLSSRQLQDGFAYRIDRFDELAIRMRKGRRPVVFNGEDWGLADEQLPEMTVC